MTQENQSRNLRIKFYSPQDISVVSWGAVESPFGTAVLIFKDRWIFALGFAHDIKTDDVLKDFKKQIKFQNATEDFETAKLHMDNILNHVEAPLNLAINGTELQKTVWEGLSRIPLGETLTYSELATEINKPKATRAVANAVGRNLHAFIIPCHRVINKNGSIGGFRWGANVKQQILDYERCVA